MNELAREVQLHIHTDTCWKHLRRGEPRDDAHCRMRMNGRTRRETTIDEETGSILLRRLHPWIANFNPVVLGLVKGNMDIKPVGSGTGAKAMIYYVTDYITKASLPMATGLTVLRSAVDTSHEKVGTVNGTDNVRAVRSALISTVNCMLSKQEISHQQVMSYIVGGGDHYTSHRFRLLHFGAFERLVSGTWKELERKEVPVDGITAEEQNEQMDMNVDGVTPGMGSMHLNEYVV